MKTNWAILGSLAIAGIGLWFLLGRNQKINQEISEWENLDPVGPIHSDDDSSAETSGIEHVRQVFHKSKSVQISEAI